jgi:hypothetical protein
MQLRVPVDEVLGVVAVRLDPREIRDPVAVQLVQTARRGSEAIAVLPVAPADRAEAAVDVDAVGVGVDRCEVDERLVPGARIEQAVGSATEDLPPVRWRRAAVDLGLGLEARHDVEQAVAVDVDDRERIGERLGGAAGQGDLVVGGSDLAFAERLARRRRRRDHRHRHRPGLRRAREVPASEVAEHRPREALVLVDGDGVLAAPLGVAVVHLDRRVEQRPQVGVERAGRVALVNLVEQAAVREAGVVRVHRELVGIDAGDHVDQPVVIGVEEAPVHQRAGAVVLAVVAAALLEVGRRAVAGDQRVLDVERAALVELRRAPGVVERPVVGRGAVGQARAVDVVTRVLEPEPGVALPVEAAVVVVLGAQPVGQAVAVDVDQHVVDEQVVGGAEVPVLAVADRPGVAELGALGARDVVEHDRGCVERAAVGRVAGGLDAPQLAAGRDVEITPLLVIDVEQVVNAHQPAVQPAVDRRRRDGSEASVAVDDRRAGARRELAADRQLAVLARPLALVREVDAGKRRKVGRRVRRVADRVERVRVRGELGQQHLRPGPVVVDPVAVGVLGDVQQRDLAGQTADVAPPEAVHRAVRHPRDPLVGIATAVALVARSGEVVAGAVDLHHAGAGRLVGGNQSLAARKRAHPVAFAAEQAVGSVELDRRKIERPPGGDTAVDRPVGAVAERDRRLQAEPPRRHFDGERVRVRPGLKRDAVRRARRRGRRCAGEGVAVVDRAWRGVRRRRRTEHRKHRTQRVQRSAPSSAGSLGRESAQHRGGED